MLFPREHWGGLQDGTITVALRRWRRAGVRAGGTQRAAGGVLAIDAVERVTPDEVTEADAHAAGYADRTAALAPRRARTDRRRAGTRAPELAARLGRETLPFKRDVRRLKERGLTISLAVGYRLSPRGEAVLARLRRDAG